MPKTEPVDQYELRGDLYELFHYLNHTVLFGVSNQLVVRSIDAELRDVAGRIREQCSSEDGKIAARARVIVLSFTCCCVRYSEKQTTNII
jgi:hypothetical protein